MNNKKLLLLILPVIVVLFSCDGRDRIYKPNVQVLKKHNLLESFTKQTKFVPEQKIQIETDTILSNGFEIKIQYHSVENNELSKTIVNTKTKSPTRYKNFEANLHVLKNGLTLNKSVINKELFSNSENSTFLNQAIMQFVWIDYQASTPSQLILNTSFNIPGTDSYRDFVILIDELGRLKLKEINLTANII
ncbi:DUF4738 domain-containing protein [Algibacter pectinivorans]|uniref:DUF4738 domain-containing protein n=1 Tax=Algibacter pectinivorans TaxID=870482 RepID=UPI001C312864|nr:DUF4738 domain-containing protein [Algibacter pectinivorans]